MQRIGLYYPYVHVRDESWIKAAALYWPQVARVVPQGFRVHDTETAYALKDGLDFLVDVDPSAAASAIAPGWLRILNDHSADLRRRYLAGPGRLLEVNDPGHRVRGVGAQVTVEPASSTAHLALPTRQRPLAGLYWNEVDPALRDALFASGLAVATSRSRYTDAWPGEWVATDPSLAWAYKCVLTQELARRTRFAPLTDRVGAHSATGTWDDTRIAEVLLGQSTPVPDQDIARMVGHLAIELVVPADLESVPVERIIKLRTDHGAEFTAFTSAVADLARELEPALGGIEDPQALRLYLDQAVNNSFREPLRELRAALRGAPMKAATGIMGLSLVPSGATTYAASTAFGQGALATAVATGGTVALGMVALRQTTAAARDAAMGSSPAGYLLRAEHELPPVALLKRIPRALARLSGSGL
ncbi:DUF6236 family protein [Embleya sp. NPDC059237]|uniref:DUF6236 family protein n=1 Tax=unclassified Embleya TaxID=2699296 RepID=UPI0036982118